MRDLTELDAFRIRDERVLSVYDTVGDDKSGAFEIPFGGWMFTVIAAAGDGWDHVSVSTPRRCPSWNDMDFIKRRFFKDDEIAMQLHVAPKDHISNHPYTLHLWRPHDVAIPLPPKDFV